MGLIKRTVRAKVKTPLKRAARTQARKVSIECPTCHKRYTNPLTHTCVVKTDFGKRKRAAERAAKAEERRQKRREATQRKREAARARKKAAADRRKAAAAERRKKARAARSAPRSTPQRQQHDYHTCRDEDCRRHACIAYREGIADCPLEHV